MRTVTDILLDDTKKNPKHDLRSGLKAGTDLTNKTDYKDAIEAYNAIRMEWGFKGTSTPHLLTAPEANAKLSMSSAAIYGLTLAHHVNKFPARPELLYKEITVNACPWAGECVAVCVLDAGQGTFPAVQNARKSKTELLVREPYLFGVILGRELQRIVNKEGYIHFRPNVNSDIEWEKVLPELVDGTLWGNSVVSYGYTKNPEVLKTNGWLHPNYRVSYSYNENSQPHLKDIKKFLSNGGSVAIVSNRKKKDPVIGFLDYIPSTSADEDDLWMFTPGVIGDLSAKGKAKKKTNGKFIQRIY